MEHQRGRDGGEQNIESSSDVRRCEVLTPQWPSTQIPLFSQTRQSTRCGAVAATVEKERVNWCDKIPFFGGIEAAKKNRQKKRKCYLQRDTGQRAGEVEWIFDETSVQGAVRRLPRGQHGESRAEACGREGRAAAEAKRVLLKKDHKGSLPSAIPWVTSLAHILHVISKMTWLNTQQGEKKTKEKRRKKGEKKEKKYIHTYVFIYIHIYMHVCICMCMYIFICIHICVCIYMYMYMLIYIYVYIYTHTSTYAHICTDTRSYMSLWNRII